MRLTERVHLVASGYLGLGLTDPHDCHAYLIDGGDDAVLVDAGCGLATGPIVDAVRRVRPVSRILLTHAHPDHAGGAAALAEALDARVLAGADAVPPLRAGDEDACGLAAARAAGTYPKEMTMTPVAAEVLPPGPLTVGDLTLDVVPTPGHAAGHTAFLLTEGARTILFSGDLVFARSRVAVLTTPDTDLGALATSLRRVAALKPDVLLAGHAEPVLSQATTHLNTAVAYLDVHALPPGLLP